MRGIVLFAVLALAACASTPGPDEDRYGTVESVRAVALADSRAAEAALAGAAVGSVLGEAIGAGGVGATLLGTLGGGIAGHELARDAGRTDGQEIVVRLDSGASVTLVQPGIEDFAPRQRVRVHGRMIFHQ